MRGFTGNIEDRIAIRERIEAYSDAVFRRDADDWAECWAEDAIWQVGESRAEGRAAIRELWLQLMSGFEMAGMYVTHAAVAIDTDVADARSYLLELLRGVDGSERVVSGRYDDRLRRDVDGDWRFVSRSYSVLQVR